MKLTIKDDDNPKVKKKLIDGHLVKYVGKFVVMVDADKQIFNDYEVHAGIEITLVPR